MAADGERSVSPSDAAMALAALAALRRVRDFPIAGLHALAERAVYAPPDLVEIMLVEIRTPRRRHGR